MKTFHIQTLGCKVNQYESDGISVGLENKGWVRHKTRKGADLFIINTCAVTAKAGMQSRQAIRKIIRDNPDATVIVTGCHAQTDPDQIRQIDHVDQIVCHRDKVRIADEIDAICSHQADLPFIPPDHTGSNKFKGFSQVVQGEMTRAYLKIQDGCDAFCTYCIVPYARGSSVSMPETDVMAHLKELGRQGFSEVILTGIHTGMYGLDFSKKTTLTRLLQTINQSRPVERVRLSSIEPTEISDGMIALAQPGQVLCNHFHIPLQSGNDRILEKMKRPYTGAFFEQMILKIHNAVPGVGIGIDVLVGFPGETDEEFESTYQLIERLPATYLHVFPFSPREGTPAFHFKPKVNTKVIKERTARLRELDNQKKERFIRSQLNRPLKGLVQHKPDTETGMLKAVTSNYLTVLLEKSPGLKGKIVDLEIKSCGNDLVPVGQILC